MSAQTALTPKRFLTLLHADTRNISRDPTLLFVICMAFGPLIIFGIWGAQIDAKVMSSFGLVNFTWYALPAIYCLPAFLIGWVTGFLLLEDRDDGPLLAVDVTPLGKTGFFSYRILTTASITGAITLLTIAVLAPQSALLLWVILPILIAIESATLAFALPALARNKVEGLAISKLANIFAAIPLVALVPSAWRYLASIFPTYWLGEIVYQSGHLPITAAAAIALVLHLALLWLCARIALRRIG